MLNYYDINVEDLKIEDLPEDIRDIVETIGLEAFFKLVDLRGGGPIYIHKAESYCRMARNRKIKQEFNGCNHRELARRYDLAVSTIYQILSEMRVSSHATPEQEQLSIF